MVRRPFRPATGRFPSSPNIFRRKCPVSTDSCLSRFDCTAKTRRTNGVRRRQIASSPSLAASGGKHTDTVSTQPKCGAEWRLVGTSQTTDTPRNCCSLAADKKYLRISEENSPQGRIRKQCGDEAAINTASEKHMTTKTQKPQRKTDAFKRL